MSTSLELRRIELRVPDLVRSADFYTERLGFVVRHRDANSVHLAVTAASPSILVLSEDREATAPPPGSAGLFHAALLFPTRAALGGWLQHAASHGVEFHGFSDHAVSEAIYFADPDGNGLEFYADRPRELWPVTDGQVEMTTQPLNLKALLESAQPSQPPLAGARWGHLHLRVTNLEASERFYLQTLGLSVTQRSYPGARFLAADGYHHHLGLNVWGHPRFPQPHHALGLAQAVFARSDASGKRVTRDPDAMAIGIEPM